MGRICIALDTVPISSWYQKIFFRIDTTTIDSGYRPIGLSNPGIAPMIG
jgi:hypothetical protein